MVSLKIFSPSKGVPDSVPSSSPFPRPYLRRFVSHIKITPPLQGTRTFTETSNSYQIRVLGDPRQRHSPGTPSQSRCLLELCQRPLFQPDTRYRQGFSPYFPAPARQHQAKGSHRLSGLDRRQPLTHGCVLYRIPIPVLPHRIALDGRSQS